MTIKTHDIVKVTDKGHPKFNKQGIVTSVGNRGPYVRMQGENYARSFWHNQVGKIENPGIGDLVTILRSGRWEAHEGHVTLITGPEDNRMYSVDLGDDVIGFSGYELEIIERIPPLRELRVVRIEGQEIHHSHVEPGDEVRVEIVRSTLGMKITETIEGTFRNRNYYGTLFSEGSGVLMNALDLKVADSVTVTLIKKAEDQITVQLRELKEGSVVTWNGGDNFRTMRVALKIGADSWNVMAPFNASQHMEDQVARFICDNGNSDMTVLKEVK